MVSQDAWQACTRLCSVLGDCCNGASCQGRNSQSPGLGVTLGRKGSSDVCISALSAEENFCVG